MKNTNGVIGIDEAGRGPLAGAVYVGGVWVPEGFCDKDILAELTTENGFKDSKKLSHKKRTELFKLLKKLHNEGAVVKTYAYSTPTTIDRYGMTYAISFAIKRLLARMNAGEQTRIMLDGLLSAPVRYSNQETIKEGDTKELTISLASIVAKVMRDTAMEQIDKKLPQYGFARHKGYGTKEHRLLIEKYGLSSVHRRRFCGNIVEYSGRSRT